MVTPLCNFWRIVKMSGCITFETIFIYRSLRAISMFIVLAVASTAIINCLYAVSAHGRHLSCTPSALMEQTLLGGRRLTQQTRRIIKNPCSQSTRWLLFSFNWNQVVRLTHSTPFGWYVAGPSAYLWGICRRQFSWRRRSKLNYFTFGTVYWNLRIVGEVGDRLVP